MLSYFGDLHGVWFVFYPVSSCPLALFPANGTFRRDPLENTWLLIAEMHCSIAFSLGATFELQMRSEERSQN